MDFGGILVIFRFQGVFWSFLGVGGYFGHLLGFGVFWSFFGFQGYFGHFLGFRGILVIFWVSEIFWSFFGFLVYFGNF